MALDISYIFKSIWANKNTSNAPLPPESQAIPNSGRTSLDTGFPPECSKAIADGGVPPYGQDFNGILRQITANLEWYSRGGQFNWDSTRSYSPPAIVGYNGAFYLSVADSKGQTPAQSSAYWKKLLDYSDMVLVKSEIDSALSSLTGTIAWFACDAGKQGAGYLVCDGTQVSRTTYASLFSVIGVKYGVGDGKTTFTLPNLIDRVAWGGKSGIGGYKSAGLPNITGRGGMGEFRGNTSGAYYEFMRQASGAFYWDTSKNYYGSSGGIDVDDALMCFDASKSNSIYGNSTTVQPPAVVLLPCIHI